MNAAKITPNDLARVKPVLREDCKLLDEYMARPYDHAAQSRQPAGESKRGIFPSSTFWDGERS